MNIKRGFHRFGLLLLVPCLVVAIGSLGLAGWDLYYSIYMVSSETVPPVPTGYVLDEKLQVQTLAANKTIFAFAAIMTGGLLYALSWVTGWIIRGFIGKD